MMPPGRPRARQKPWRGQPWVIAAPYRGRPPAAMGGCRQRHIGRDVGFRRGFGPAANERTFQDVAPAVGAQAQVRPKPGPVVERQRVVGAARDDQRGLLAIESGQGRGYQSSKS